MSPSRRCAIARGGSPPRCAAWQVAHAESFACRGSVRGTVRGRAAYPARCPHHAASPHAIAPPVGAPHPPGAASPSARCAAWHRAPPRPPPRAPACGLASRPSRRPRAQLPRPHRKPSKLPTDPPRLCAPIRPAPSLFVFLCVNKLAPAHRPWSPPPPPGVPHPRRRSKTCHGLSPLL